MSALLLLLKAKECVNAHLAGDGVGMLAEQAAKGLVERGRSFLGLRLLAAFSFAHVRIKNKSVSRIGGRRSHQVDHQRELRRVYTYISSVERMGKRKASATQSSQEADSKRQRMQEEPSQPAAVRIMYIFWVPHTDVSNSVCSRPRPIRTTTTAADQTERNNPKQGTRTTTTTTSERKSKATCAAWAPQQPRRRPK